MKLWNIPPQYLDDYHLIQDHDNCVTLFNLEDESIPDEFYAYLFLKARIDEDELEERGIDDNVQCHITDDDMPDVLEFEEPDLNRFPCIRLAYEAGIKGGTYPAVLNALNEEAVYAFLNGKIKLTDIAKIVEKGMEIHKNIENPDLKDVIDADNHAREQAREIIPKYLLI